MEVNENGVEASAVTGIELVTLKGGVPEMYFFLDRPFVFFIIEKTTQMVDFAGIVQTPLEWLVIKVITMFLPIKYIEKVWA